MDTRRRDAELLGVVTSLARIARVLVRERYHLQHATRLAIVLVAYLAIWPDMS
jgi:hypothetical protein